MSSEETTMTKEEELCLMIRSERSQIRVLERCLMDMVDLAETRIAYDTENEINAIDIARVADAKAVLATLHKRQQRQINPE